MRKSFVNITSGGLGYILPIALNLLATPLIIKALGTEAYGIQSLVNVIIGFLMVADMGLDIPVTRAVSEYKMNFDPEKLNRLLNSTLLIYLLIGLLGLIIIGLFAPLLVAHVFKIKTEFRDDALWVFYLAGFGFIGSLFSMWGKSVFNGFLRYDISNGINVVCNTLSLVLGTVLVIRGYGVVAYVFVRVIFTFLSGFAYLVACKVFLKSFHFNLGIHKEIWESLRSQVGYGFLLRISGILTSRLDQTLIGIWIGVAAVGFYSIPVLIITSVGGLINSMTHYLFPQISELNSVGKKTEIKTLFLTASRYIGMLVFFLYAPLITLGNKFLFIWVGDEIAKSTSTLFILLIIATILNTLFTLLLNSYLVAVGKLDLFTKYTLFRSIALGLGFVLLLKRMGLEGAGWAMIMAGILDVIFYIFINSKYVKVNPIPLFSGLYSRLLIISIVCGLVIKVGYLHRVENFTTLVVAGVMYVTSFLFLCVLLKVFNKEEKAIFKLIRSRFTKIVMSYYK